MVYHAIRKKDVQNFLKLALFITKNGNAPGVPDPKYHFFGFFSDNYKILHQFLPGFLKKHKKGHIVPTLLRDRSIFMGIRDREICNGTTGYFGPLVERGHRLF